MKSSIKLLYTAGFALAGTVAFASPASAQATRTWVSGTGDDANPCSRTAPCKTFAGSISKTAAGGEINCIDAGGFGAVTINKSITILCDETEAGVLVSGTNGIVINDGGAGTAQVTLSGLDLEGLGFTTSGSGIRGVWFISGASLVVRNSTIRNFRDATNGTGIAFTPSTTAKLLVDNVSVTGNGNGTAGGGIVIQPTGSGSSKATITNSRIFNNGGTGVLTSAVGLTAGTALYTEIRGSEISNNNAGVGAISPPSTRSVMVTTVHSTSSQNTLYGVLSNGSSAQNRLSDDVININGTGVQSAAGGFLLSYGDNLLFGNTTDGTFSSTLPKQ
ncbi:hypothetical protein [Sphingomonas sp.]|jgi:hypothetical protein|uniref:hypothetical protein n=1 Tax=Sphingomonas sp. TaxID=28214 RepID=UPI002E30A078|nr:hypothetical protein [Sphingomonas sp.]HEX4694079.1 hypothetical protein [Sphingomonas sp.]